MICKLCGDLGDKHSHICHYMPGSFREVINLPTCEHSHSHPSQCCYDSGYIRGLETAITLTDGPNGGRHCGCHLEIENELKKVKGEK